MLFASILVAALVGTGGVSGGRAGQSCKVTLQVDLLPPGKEPLVLAVKETEIRIKDASWTEDLYPEDDFNNVEVEELSIAYPDVENGKGVVNVEDKQQLLLSCPGKNNYNRGNGEQSAYMMCNDGQLQIGGKRANKYNMVCSRIYAESFLKVSEDTCGDGSGVIVQLGFELDDGSWFPFVDACHDVANSNTLYCFHELIGHSLKGAVKSSERRKFTRGPPPLYTQVNPDSVYTQKGQKKALDKILGDKGSEMYLNNTSFMARGHLAPDADFIYNSQQLMTYYYANAAPQWQPFNAGNWLAIENAVRVLADKVEETIYVWTGTYGVLKLANADGVERLIYLDPTNKLIAVPEVYWKVVQHPVTNACTVAIGHNNVFLKEPPTPICSTVNPDGWPTLTTLNKGYTYYCDYDSFKVTVPYAPNLDCKDLFEFPQKTQ